jgi:hypothetical protein
MMLRITGSAVGSVRQANFLKTESKRTPWQNWTLLFSCTFLITSLVFLCTRTTPFYILNIPDDGYYYLVVARNLAEGLGPTFDGITVTNGFHPLLAFLLAALFRIIPDIPLGDIRIAIAVGGICHLLTGWLLVLALRRTSARKYAELAGVLYWINPYAFLRSFGAMEPPVYALCLALLLYLLLRFGPDLRDAARPSAAAVLVGLAAGLTLLARTDAVFLIPLVGLAVWLPRPFGTRIAWKAASLVATATTIVVLPWVLYSWKHFGTVWQFSGLMKSFERSQVLESMNQGAAALAIADNYWIWIRKSLVTAPLMKYVIVAILISGLLSVRRSRRTGRRLRFRGLRLWVASIPAALWIYTLFVLLLGLYYAFNTQTVRGWYLVPASVLMSVVSVHALRRLPAARRMWRAPAARWVVIGLLLAESILYPAVKLGRGIQREQADTYLMVDWAAAHLDPGARVGCFNAGIPAYFLDNPVINLDGLVNNDMLAVFRERDLGTYLENRRIRYILDHEDMGPVIRYLAGNEWTATHVREVHSLPGPEIGRRLVVWEVY